MKRLTYQEMCEALAAGNQWLSTLGIREQQDRIRQHIRRIERLEQQRQAGMLDAATQGDDGRLAMFSLTEAMEFLDVYEAFRENHPPALSERLRDALNGPVDLGDESNRASHGRNIMFELNIAGRLQCVGLHVSLPVNPDVLTELLQKPIYIQCKRPFQASTMAVNIDRARHQLTRDLDAANDPRACGVIAISVSRVFTPGDQLFVGPNEATLKNRLGDEVETLGRSMGDSWNGIADGRIIGILFHLITPTHIQDVNLLTVAQETIVFPLPGRPNADIELLKQFTNAISEG